MKTVLITVLWMLPAFLTDDKLTGRWESPVSPKGNITGIVFNPDNSFEGYVNRKPFVSGHYQLQDSIFSFTDNGCGGQRGVYKIIFFSYNDSMRFSAISDSCLERKEGMRKLVLGRVREYSYP